MYFCTVCISILYRKYFFTLCISQGGEREIDFMQLAQKIVGVGKSEICQAGQQARGSGRISSMLLS